MKKINREVAIIREISRGEPYAFKTFKQYRKHEVIRIFGLSGARVTYLLQRHGIAKNKEGWYPAKSLRRLVRKRSKNPVIRARFLRKKGD